ncbi:hypothetical protein YPPY36_3511, partial [Yersinia pestis PY-36]
MAWQG